MYKRQDDWVKFGKVYFSLAGSNLDNYKDPAFKDTRIVRAPFYVLDVYKRQGLIRGCVVIVRLTPFMVLLISMLPELVKICYLRGSARCV